MSTEPKAKPPRELTAEEKIIRKIEASAEELGKVIPKHVGLDRFLRTVKTAIKLNPELHEADVTSILGACMKAAQDGLLLDGREAALVTFSVKEKGPGGAERWVKKAQYMPMFQGILKKIRNSGDLATIEANVVYEKDTFDYELGDNSRLTHKPLLVGDRGKAILVYAIAVLKDGSRMREVMTVQDVEAIRACGKGTTGQGSPWVKWWGEMAKKSVIRRLAKRLPSSADIDSVFQHDDEGFDFAAHAPEPLEDDGHARPKLPGKKARGAAAAALAADPEPEPPTGHDPETGEIHDQGEPEDRSGPGPEDMQEREEDPV
jgi:recombination protein RecT